MVRGIYENGKIRPLSPPPSEWSDGRELTIEEVSDSMFPAIDPPLLSLEKWFEELQASTDEIDPADHLAMTNALAEADESAKRMVRREMGLSE